jgi:hypothetical protein
MLLPFGIPFQYCSDSVNYLVLLKPFFFLALLTKLLRLLHFPPLALEPSQNENKLTLVAELLTSRPPREVTDSNLDSDTDPSDRFSWVPCGPQGSLVAITAQWSSSHC